MILSKDSVYYTKKNIFVFNWKKCLIFYFNVKYTYDTASSKLLRLLKLYATLNSY